MTFTCYFYCENLLQKNIINSYIRAKKSPNNAEEIDPEFAAAYRKFLSRVNHDGTKGKEALLSDGAWNEVIVSNPIIGGIYTANLKTISESMLAFAQENDIPIVVLKKR